MESGEGATSAPSTHIFSKAQGSQGDWSWLEAWKVIEHAHADKTKGVYGVPPLPPDLKRDVRKAVAECLDGTALDLTAKLRARGIERELAQVRQDLASRVMALYFKNDNAHLRRVKHALRDLPREFHARITDAMHAISRESHDANPPRRPPVVVLEEKPVDAPTQKAANPANSAPAEKPLPVNVTRACSRKVLEMLEAASPKDEAAKPQSKAKEPDCSKAMQEQGHNDVQRTPEAVLATASPPLQRSTGRLGAPRWGALVPTPTKVRSVSRLQLPEPEGAPNGLDGGPLSVDERPEPHPRE
jgi:hypothetical protein